jgi:hypothetical protein
MQKGGGIESSVDSDNVDDVTGRKQRWILHAEPIDPNGERGEAEAEPSYFDLFSRFLLEIRDYLGTVAIHVEESWHKKKNCSKDDGGDNEENGGTADGHKARLSGLRYGFAGWIRRIEIIRQCGRELQFVRR